MTVDRKIHLIQMLKSVLAELAGKDLSEVDPQATFFELGFDSLLLTQVAALLKNRFRVKITFRQLLEELTTLEALARYIDERMPADFRPVIASGSGTPVHSVSVSLSSEMQREACDVSASAAPIPTVTRPSAETSAFARANQKIRDTMGSSGNSLLERVMKEQLALMARQLEMLNGKSAHIKPLSGKSIVTDMPPPAASTIILSQPAIVLSPALEAKAKVAPQAFGPYRPINAKDAGEFTGRQQQALSVLMDRYQRKTRRSKEQTQNYRAQLADPRSVAGFRTFWKEMVYPIVTERSAGARFWDVDGNEYIDVTMGFGTNLLGHNPSFITEAIAEQLKKGIEVGPQSPLAGNVAQLLCELSGHDRAAFCNTGSEAVLAAIRVARTVTGRTRIATTGGFHGICDEVLVRANVVNGKRTTVPVAPGIPDHVAREVLVVDYGTKEGLEILEANMDDLAMVLIEPVQSRHPDLQPREFLQELRRITAAHETVLFFDEVITGFRCNLGGAQAHFGVQADMASWGKVIGGGMPIGALTGAAKYMDALDGGSWNYGDDSFPEVGVTFFAGTYIRHPLAMAASHAILKYLKQKGPKLQEQLTAKTEQFVAELRTFLKLRAVPLHVEQFASMFYLHFGPEIKQGSLLWFYLRDKGVHFWEGRPGFLSTAHTDEDIRYLLHAIKESVIEMQEAGFLPEAPADTEVFKTHFEFPRLRGPALIATPSGGSERLSEKRNGFHKPDASHISVSVPPVNAVAASGKQIDFSIYFFGNYAAEYHPDKYRLVIEAAKFADVNGFKAIWLPERHFHAVGGFSPNPSVIAAALARETKQLHLRAGSVVLPLHHPVRVAEEWAVVDNLSNGRAGISIASGWHPNDFVFAPDAFDKRRELCWEGYEIIQKLWQGGEVEFPTGGKNRLNVKLHPMPKQPKLPTWLTCIHKESFIKAGELGLGVLGYTMNTTLEELAEKIRLYREAFAKHGHDPRQANVTILMHTFIGSNCDAAQQTARQPMRDYLRTYLDNSQKRLENQHAQVEVDKEDIEYLLDRGFEDYLKGKALIGSLESCAVAVDKIKEMGVDEIGCFLDFGVDPDVVLAQLPYIAELKQICSRQSEDRDGMKINNIPDRLIPLPEAQKGLVAITAFGQEASRAYTEANTLVLRGPLNLAALRRALQRCIDRHEALRASLNVDGETQTIHAHVTLDVAFEDLSTIPPDSQIERQNELFKKLGVKQFDLHSAPVMAAQVIKLAADRHLLVLLFHHTLGNGPSYWILLEDLCAFYDNEHTGTPLARPEPMQLSRFVDWRTEYAATAEYQASEQFWLQQFADGVPELNLPTDRPRSPIKTYFGGRCMLRLDATLTQALRQAGAVHRCSLYMFLLAGFKVLMHRLSDQDDLVLGTPFDSEVRSLPGGEALFANTTNMTLVRSRVKMETTFTELLSVTKSQILECQEHQDFFFGNLLQKLKIRSESNRLGLFSVGFNYETGTFKKNVAGIEVEFLTHEVPYRCPKDTAIFDLNFNVAEKGGELLCECDYDADLFDGATILRMLNQFELLLKTASANPQQLVSKISLLSEAERRQIVVGWNQTPRDYPQGQCIHELFEAQAAHSPEAVALVWEDQSLSYRELNARANQLAHHLRHLGVGSETLVGLLVERSLEMVVGLLAILKAGGAYVPMDPHYPHERLAFMLTDARCPVVITQKDLVKILSATSARTVLLDSDWPEISQGSTNNPASGSRPDHLAYVIYTSGSTGTPKGVAIEHRNTVNFIHWGQEVFSDAEMSGVLAATSICFDLSIFELFVTLSRGGKVILAENALQLPHLAAKGLVTLINTVPSAMAELVQAGGVPPSVQVVNLAGEALPTSLVDQIYALKNVKKVNDLYGPTETTTYSTFTLRQPGAKPTIGRPIANTQCYVVDGHLQPVPLGVVGELYIAGNGVARGYLNRPELTAGKFVADPFNPEPGARFYKTGDLARYLPDGNLEFLGRIDQQVKLRGFRIELGEIESLFQTNPIVKECVAVLREDASNLKRLVAYVSLRAPGDADAPGNHEEELTGQWRNQWETTYDSAVAEAGEQSEGLQNIDSIINSWTGLENNAAQTKEWIEATIARIKQSQPRRIIEIGCGTGQILLRLAPQSEMYWGTDFALPAIQGLQKEVGKRAIQNVSLLHRAAGQLEGIPEAAFDLYVLNSVSQYFPDPEYLARVIERGAKTVALGGQMFIGDVQSWSLLECYHAAMQVKAAPDQLTVGQLRDRVRQRVEQEAELVVDPEFFLALQRRVPEITAVDVQLRRGRIVNETTQYHYDVILHLDRKVKTLKVPAWIDWSAEQLTIEALHARLEVFQPEILGIRAVPNNRLQHDIQVFTSFQAAPSQQTVFELRKANANSGEGIDLENLWIIGEQLGYHVDIRWSGSGIKGQVDVVFSRPEKRGRLCVTDFEDVGGDLKSLSRYANNPALALLSNKVPKVLKELAQARLPEHMVPSAIVLLAAVPRTPNGKIDRKALPAPPVDSAIERKGFLAPRNAMETKLAEIWMEVLGLEKVSVLDNFFELGGDSLLIFRVANRANQVGIPLTPRMFFQHKTITNLIRAVGEVQKTDPKHQQIMEGVL